MGWKSFEKAVKKISGYDTAKGLWDDFTGKSAIDKQNQYNMQMWQMQNEYNTPANQMQRYLDAGLNPNLIYSQGTSGNASSAPEMTAHQGSAAKLLGLLGTVVGLKGQLEGQSLEKAKVLSSIQHSADLLEFQKKQAIVDQLFKQADLDFKKRELGIRTSWKDREYNLAVDRLNFERSKPYGGAIGFADKIIHGVTGKSTTDVATDTGNLLNNYFSDSYDNLLNYSWKKGVGNLTTFLLRKFSGL